MVLKHLFFHRKHFNVFKAISINLLKMYECRYKLTATKEKRIWLFTEMTTNILSKT